MISVKRTILFQFFFAHDRLFLVLHYRIYKNIIIILLDFLSKTQICIVS